jgi:Zn-dependent protease with chaperone function
VRAAVAKPAQEQAAPKPPSRTPAQILGAFRGEIRPVRPTLLYRFWILVVALLMLVLPASYIALIGLVGYALVLHAVHDVVVFQNVRNARGALLVYLGPLVVGAIVIAFMLKPIFARSARRGKVRKLGPSTEPLVFAFVDGVCQSVGAPSPVRIEVNCDVNAWAHMLNGPLSHSRNKLVLTIGLPLLEGLELRQFAGVLAHEFGHFAQGAGMRLSRLIDSINVWFARVVYERDE